MNPLIFDTEVTGAQRNKGNPFDPRNKLCCISYYRPVRVLGVHDFAGVLDIEHGQDPFKHKLDSFQKEIDDSDLLVGFNLKFDLHWIKRYGLGWANCKVWDCQYFHFLRSNQTEKFPSLNTCATLYGFDTKLDVIRLEYWDKGLDTDVVPWELLEEYAAYDAELTFKVFQKQLEEYKQWPKNRRNLFQLHMRDLLVLAEMEHNGSEYNKDLSIAMGIQLEKDIVAIDEELGKYVKDITISFNSDQQISAFLYGGKVVQTEVEEYTFTYKDGRQAQKFRRVNREYTLPKIFEPLRNTGKAKDGVYSVATDTLKTLKSRAKGFKLRILENLLTRSRLEKQKSTYCFGTPKLLGYGEPKRNQDMGWEKNILHGQLNQCVTVTGRLSCEKPNLQNQDGKMKICFTSRFPSVNKRRREGPGMEGGAPPIRG